MNSQTCSIISCVSHHAPVRPVHLVSYQPHYSWFGRHIRWINEDRKGISKVAVDILKTLETVILRKSGIGFLLFYQLWKEHKLCELEKQFFLEKQVARKPPTYPIEGKSDTYTFNHIFDFAIEDQTIWYRIRQQASDWQPMYFDGYANGRVPVCLDSDGENLIVIDQMNDVHYRKIIHEYHGADQTKKGKAGVRLKLIRIDAKQDDYIAFEKIHKNNWKDQWFSLPLLYLLFHLVYRKRLRLPEGTVSWAISQRGQYNHYVEDAKGQKHLNKGSVTTLGVLEKSKRDILQYGPWSPPHVKLTIPLPETSKSYFEGEKIRYAGSVVMAIGYETIKGSQHQQLKIQTRMADMDYEGWNPWMKYSYFPKKDHFVVSTPKWKDHSLVLQDKSAIQFVTKNITIIQIGEGNEARELRVDGNYEGKRGFYFKTLNEDYWHFQPSASAPDQPFPSSCLMDLQKLAPSVFETTVHDYQATHVSFPNLLNQPSATLLNFGKRSLESSLILELDHDSYSLILHRRKTLKNFIGFEEETYDLVVPDCYHSDLGLRLALDHKKVIPVSVKEWEGKVLIQSLKWWPSFSLTFQRQAVA